MRLDPGACGELLDGAERATLATVHPVRGVDAVPVCFARHAGQVAVPVDRVKEKSGSVLQRVRNVVADHRAALLCDHWDPADWGQLWWVRASLELVAGPDGPVPDGEPLLQRLERKYPPYAGRPFDGLLVFRITALNGWAASREAVTGSGSDG